MRYIICQKCASSNTEAHVPWGNIKRWFVDTKFTTLAQSELSVRKRAHDPISKGSGAGAGAGVERAVGFW